MTQYQIHQAQSSLSSHYIGGIGDWLRYHAWYRPTAEALVDNEDRVSYGELDRRVNLAADVLAGLGVSKGARVCLLMLNSSASSKPSLPAPSWAPSPCP